MHTRDTNELAIKNQTITYRCLFFRDQHNFFSLPPNAQFKTLRANGWRMQTWRHGVGSKKITPTLSISITDGVFKVQWGAY